MRNRTKNEREPMKLKTEIRLCPHCRGPFRLAVLLPESISLADVRVEALRQFATTSLKDAERVMILNTVSQTHNIVRAAKLLGLGRTTLYRRLKKYNVDATV